MQMFLNRLTPLLIGVIFAGVSVAAGCSHKEATPAAATPPAVPASPVAANPAPPAPGAVSGDSARYQQMMRDNPSIVPGARGPVPPPGH